MANEVRLDSLRPKAGSRHSRKRVGRGQGSGYGGTSTRGHKGAQSRSGYSRKIGFEGGQMPLQRRVPKFGFKNPFRVAYRILNLSELEQLAAEFSLSEITPEILHRYGKVKRTDRVKILGGGELTLGLNVSAHAFSASAKESIEKVNGVATIL